MARLRMREKDEERVDTLKRKGSPQSTTHLRQEDVSFIMVMAGIRALLPDGCRW